ncbi:hypothetical protein [Pedobacter nyackensis]|uniref:Branched-chain amino acid:cation transporter, LIVCS family n=1 Tax=Pedobacter nyackensis TaxID=475255 RepID=A0A1W2CGP5_9SPHI|nr:hypothetical protein [Pedobacter nyackensis]SMC84052.1 hypothetical protein SAMN04488101_1046 [Pedobacter nyackensis]
METTSIDQITAIGKGFAKYSFLIGTALFLIYIVTKFNPLIYVGLLYLSTAMIGNLIILLTLLITIIIYPKDYLLLKTATIMLLNLPIAFLYLLIITEIPL